LALVRPQPFRVEVRARLDQQIPGGIGGSDVRLRLTHEIFAPGVFESRLELSQRE